MMGDLRALWRDFLIVRLLRRRGWKRREDWIIRRNSDGHLFAPGSPQNFAYAMRGLFSGRHRDSFHFCRVREWHGLLVSSPKLFWCPQRGEFELLFKATRFDLPAWSEPVECAKIDAMSTDQEGTGGSVEGEG